MAAGLQDTTIRDYGGGWNVSDSDLNLSSRYQPISNNISRGIDGSFGPRQGTALFGDFANGMTTDMGTQRLVIATTAAIETMNNIHFTPFNAKISANGSLTPSKSYFTIPVKTRAKMI